MAIEKSRYFLAFYVANSGAGHVTGCLSFETFGTGTFFSRIQAEKRVEKFVPDAWGIVFTGFQRLTKEEYEQWHSKE
jgi:hypothetical protein